MNTKYYQNIIDAGSQKKAILPEMARDILLSSEVELLPLLQAAFEIRKKWVGKEVTIHIINNAQNGHCPEDCHYCPQAMTSEAGIKEYPLKADEEILSEARQAYESGAFRYCMVFAGRGPSEKRIEHLSRLISKIKSQYPIEVCVSPGILDESKAKKLKEAGLDRLNHNLNTSEAHYPNVCTTHTYHDRISTLKAAKSAGLQLCSGIIVGMNETTDDIIEVAYSLCKLEAKSIPVNFLVPIDGNEFNRPADLTPEFCLRILCLFRILNPTAEIRVAAGREIYFRSMEVMALYPANSLFLDGYLNTKGASRQKTLRMIKDAGFTIKSDHSIEELLDKESNRKNAQPDNNDQGILKDLIELRPFVSKQLEK